MKNLVGRRAIVTGGLGGIGASVVRGLLTRGASTAIVDSRPIEAACFGEMPVTFVQGDLSTAQGAADASNEAIARLGGVDIYVNSVGITKETGFLDAEPELFESIFAVNLRGAYFSSQAVARHMKLQGSGGSIIHISSISGQRGNVLRSIYGPSKAALINLTQVCAVELAEFGIRVNAVAPGPTETPMMAVYSAESKAKWYDRIPMKRYARPEEIASAVLYIASDESSFMTGAVLNIDGGFLACGLT